EEKRTLDTEVLRPLRGDFFCMPFGGNNAWRGEDHPAHGEVATARWKHAALQCDDGVRRFSARMDTAARPGRVTKELTLVDGQNVIYTAHTLEGFGGKMCLGHHATLAVPPEEGGLLVSSSPFALGMTNPGLFSDPAEGEYQSLAIGAKFRRLDRVPTLWKDCRWADCSSFPRRAGFTDLLALMKKPGKSPAWMTAVCPSQGYLWFSLKDPSVLPTTAFWISNRGRHGAPWDGRNRCLGLEDVCAYFAEGLADSARKNELNEAGFPTTITLSKRRPSVIRYIEGAVAIPKSFSRVKTARFGPDEVTFTDENGKSVTAAVRHGFLHDGAVRD
ncbi:MAG: hypothetical protein ACLFV7_07100, partial [Phycisphaerae bacterium]